MSEEEQRQHCLEAIKRDIEDGSTASNFLQILQNACSRSSSLKPQKTQKEVFQEQLEAALGRSSVKRQSGLVASPPDIPERVSPPPKPQRSVSPEPVQTKALEGTSPKRKAPAPPPRRVEHEMSMPATKAEVDNARAMTAAKPLMQPVQPGHFAPFRPPPKPGDPPLPVFYPPPGFSTDASNSAPPSKQAGAPSAKLVPAHAPQPPHSSHSSAAPASNRISAQPAAPAVPSHFRPTAMVPPPSKEPPLPSKPRKVKALQDFEAQETADLPFRKGDVLFVSKQIDENWYEGSLNGKVGIFPIGFVESIQ